MSRISKIKQYVGSTHFKTAIWYSGLFLVMEVTIGIIIYLYIQGSMYNRLDRSLIRQAESIYNLVSEKKVDLNDFKPDSIYSSADDLVFDLIFEAVSYNPQNTYVQIQLKEKIIYRSENLRGDTIPFPEKSKKNIQLKNLAPGGLSVDHIRTVYYTNDDYKIAVGFPLHIINEVMTSLVDIYLIITPLFLVISVAGGVLISRRSLSRIDRIIEKTDEITTQNLDDLLEGGEFSDEYGRLVNTINGMINRIRTSIQYLNQFSMAASHELKTPLTILRGELELALKSERPAEAYRSVLNSNYEETLRLINIVERLFFAAKIDTQKVIINSKKTDLGSLVQKIVKQMNIIAREKNINICLECSESLILDADEDLLRQAVSNLLENAVKFGYENNTVKVACTKVDGNIEITVSNKGDIIPPEAIPFIFNRFFRVESSRNRGTGGIGLGLSIVKSIVEWHKGEISVSSTPSSTAFTIRLPAAPDA